MEAVVLLEETLNVNIDTLRERGKGFNVAPWTSDEQRFRGIDDHRRKVMREYGLTIIKTLTHLYTHTRTQLHALQHTDKQIGNPAFRGSQHAGELKPN